MTTGLQPRWPDVYTALLWLLPTLPGFTGDPRGTVQVFDGQFVGNDFPIDYVTVGFQSDDGAGSFIQQPDPSCFATTEVGDIKCLMSSNSGDTDPAVVAADRARVFALFTALQTEVTRDQSLRGALTGSNYLVTLSAQVVALENTQGAASSIVVSVAYQTTTYFM